LLHNPLEFFRVDQMGIVPVGSGRTARNRESMIGEMLMG
jgi:hypothetical protein